MAISMAAPHTVTPLAPFVLSSMLNIPSELKQPLAKPSVHSKVKIICILDSSTFYASIKDKITYKNWHLQMQNKLHANKAYMPIEFFKMPYIQSRMADNALVQISTWLENNATWLFKTAKKMLEVLTAVFANKNQKQKAHIEYRALQQRTKDFSTFWTKFQCLTAKLNHSDKKLDR